MPENKPNILTPQCAPFTLPYKASIEMRDFSVLRYNDYKTNALNGNVKKTKFDEYKEELLKPAKDSLVVSFDTEWQENSQGRREILSYQFTTYYKGQVREYMFIPKTTEALSLGDALSVIANDYKIPLQKFPTPVNEKGNKVYRDETPVYLLAHNSLCDITTLKDFEWMYRSFIQTRDVFSKKPSRVISRNRLDPSTYRPMQINVIGTMNHFDGSLAALGKSVGVEKIQLPEGTIKNMEAYRRDHFDDFAKYAMRDTHIIMEWYLNNFRDLTIPTTTSSFAERMMIRAMGEKSLSKDSLSSNLASSYNQVLEFRGMKESTVTLQKKDGTTYTRKVLEPVSPLAKDIAERASEAYSGGFNACMKVGYYDTKTYDFDLKGAYPAAATVLPDIDWNASKPKEELKDVVLTPADKARYPYTQFGFGHVSFEFPENVTFPCIALKSDSGLIFPRKGENVPATWAEVKLALSMGATVKCLDFNFYEPKRNEDRKIVGSLSNGFRFFAANRAEITNLYGKGSPQEITAKLTNNAIYGKISQNLVEHNVRDSATNTMQTSSNSNLTSPAHAAYITALIRCAVCGTMEELTEKGYNCYSVTTDGFISDAPLEEVKKCQMFGLHDVFYNSNKFLTNDKNAEIWSAKHEQERLFNISTRVNQGFQKDDVYVNNVVSAATGYQGQDFIKDYLERGEAGVHIVSHQLPNLNDMIWKGVDYIAKDIDKFVKFNYDFKRDVIVDTLEDKQVTFEGNVYNIVNFDTKPYENYDSFAETKKVVERSKMTLRNIDDYKVAMSPVPEVRDDTRGQIINAIYFMDKQAGYHEAFTKMGPQNTVKMFTEMAHNNYGVDLNLHKQSWLQMQKENKFDETLNRPVTSDFVSKIKAQILAPKVNRNISTEPSR